jgi:ABC-2 type transport system ATP-binding protein
MSPTTAWPNSLSASLAPFRDHPSREEITPTHLICAPTNLAPVDKRLPQRTGRTLRQTPDLEQSRGMSGASSPAGTGDLVAVQVSDLVVVRGPHRVIDGLNLSIGGGVTGLLGPSGSGKTTLMRALVGVQQLTSGSVRIFGEEAGSPSLRSRVGYVTQAASVYDDLTVAENLSFFAKVLGLGPAEAARTIEAVDLTAQSGQVVGRLSGGQRSRVSLAVALLNEPDLLVLDEPTVGLDPVLRKELWELFHRLADAGSAVFVSSHVMDEADRCDRLLLMREGEIIADGTPTEIKHRTGAADIEGAFLAVVAASTPSPNHNGMPLEERR